MDLIETKPEVGSPDWRFQARMRNPGPHLFPRRMVLERMTTAEAAIRDAAIAVESAGCHPWLTDVMERLREARDQLGDYVDATEEERLYVARIRGGTAAIEPTEDLAASRSETAQLQQALRLALKGLRSNRPRADLMDLAVFLNGVIAAPVPLESPTGGDGRVT